MDFTRTANAKPRRLGPAIEEILAASPQWPHGEGFFVRGVEEKRKAGTSADTIAVNLKACDLQTDPFNFASCVKL